MRDENEEEESDQERQTSTDTTPCAECGAPVGSVHKCIGCNASMHGFCGIDIGEEGFGQKRQCSRCSTAGARRDEEPPTMEEEGEVCECVRAHAHVLLRAYTRQSQRCVRDY